MALTQISTAGVKDDAVTAGKIPANAVGSSELADNAVDTAAIANDAVTTAKIADNAVDTSQLASGSVSTAKLDGSAVTTAKIADDAVTNAKIGSQAVGQGELANNAVGTAQIGDGTVTAVKLGSGVQTTINNNANDRVITGSGTANTLNGESGLTYDGVTNLKITGANQQMLTLGSTNAAGVLIVLDGDSNGDGAGGDYSFIRHNTDGNLEFFARNTGGATNTIFKQGTTEKVRIQSGGGISFNGDTAAANALDDYEEGTFTATIQDGGSSITYTLQRGSYTKIGDLVEFQIDLYLSGTANGNNLRIGGLPFTSANQNTRAFGGAFLNYSNAAFGSIPILFHIPSTNTYIQMYNQETGNVVAGNSTGVALFSTKEICLTGIYKAG